MTDLDDLNNGLGQVDSTLDKVNHTLGRMKDHLDSMNENVHTLTIQMGSVSENQSRIIDSNNRTAESCLQIQRMMFALVVLVIIGLFMMR